MGTPKMVSYTRTRPLGYFCMSTLGVPKKKEKKVDTSSNKHEIVSIFSLVLPSIKPLEHLSFILFYFGFNVEHFFYLVFWILVCTLTTI